MKKLIPLFLLLCLFACDAPKKNAYQLKIGEPVNSMLFGFNTELAFYFCNPTTLDACLPFIKELQPTSLRFPGGTSSNYYHLDQPGYGISEDAASLKIDSDDTNSRTVDKPTGSGGFDGAKMRERDKFYPGGGNVIAPFIETAVTYDIPAFFVCNMITASYEKNKRVLDSLLQAGVKIAKIELTNEPYLKNYDKKFPSVNDYLIAAKDFTKQLRTDFPTLKIGICAAPPTVVEGSTDKQKERYENWNKTIATKDFYNAVIVHHYVKNQSCETLTDHAAKLNCTYEMLQREIDETLPNVMAEYEGYFPNKEMFITEWGISKRFDDYGNTQLVNLYLAEYLHQMATRYGNKVKAMQYHNFLAAGVLYPTVSPQKPNDLSSKVFEKKAPWLVFEQAKDIFNAENAFVLPDINFVKADNKLIKLYAYLIKETSKNQLLVVAVNRSSKPAEVSLTQSAFSFDNQKFAIKSATISSIHADYLDAGLGETGFSRPKMAEHQIQQKTQSVTEKTALPAFSVNLIRVELEAEQ